MRIKTKILCPLPGMSLLMALVGVLVVSRPPASVKAAIVRSEFLYHLILEKKRLIFWKSKPVMSGKM